MNPAASGIMAWSWTLPGSMTSTMAGGRNSCPGRPHLQHQNFLPVCGRHGEVNSHPELKPLLPELNASAEMNPVVRWTIEGPYGEQFVFGAFSSRWLQGRQLSPSVVRERDGPRHRGAEGPLGQREAR